jgi:hypothetical protein
LVGAGIVVVLNDFQAECQIPAVENGPMPYAFGFAAGKIMEVDVGESGVIRTAS